MDEAAALMEIDAKMVGAALGALILGGGGGVATSQISLAALDARVAKLEKADEDLASKESVQAVKEQQRIYIEAMQVIHDDIDSRLDRHDKRLNDVEGR